VAWILIRPDATVMVVRPAVGTIQAYVEEQAVTELPRDWLVDMPINGRLLPITLREGDPVEEGQVVARIDDADLRDRVIQAQKRIAVLETEIEKASDHTLEQNALVEARATVKAINETVQAAEKKLEAARAVADFARSELERVRGIAAEGAAASRELRQAETEWRKAEAEYQSDALELAALKTLAAVSYIGPKFITDYIDRKSFDLRSYQRQLEEAQAALAMDQRNLARTTITAPVTGVVLDRHQTQGQYLPAGSPLLTVGQLENLEVEAEILTERAPHIETGDLVEIYGEAILDGPLTGEVLRVYPAGFEKISSLGVEQQRVKVTVSLSHRPEGLGVGFRVYVRIIYAEATDVLTLPRTALFRSEQGDWQVMVVRGGDTALQTVSLGLTNDERAEITRGLSADTLVIARPSREVTPGVRVATRPAGAD
jgi:HlyD family secretion protein